MIRELSVPPKIHLGGGAVAEVGAVVRSLGALRPLIVTDAFLAATGVGQTVKDSIAAAGLEAAVFSETVPDPTSASIGLGLDALRKHQADLVVGLGGGSPIDTAKAIAVLAVRGGSMRELKAPTLYDGPALPIVAIPTTAGTGSEATRTTVVTDSVSGEKMLCMGPSYLPTAAIVDYELTLTMPPRLSADTGIDALTHAVEAYVSRRRNGFSDALSLRAISIIGGNLRTVYLLHPPDWRTDLASQVEELQEGGSRVQTLVPDPEAEHLFGANAMNAAYRPTAARAGFDQGRRVAEALSELWT